MPRTWHLSGVIPVIRLEIGSNAAITIASLVIIRRLSIITRRCDPASEKRHMSSLLVDLSLCLGAPILSILLSYVVQPIRFSIIEEIGCIGAGVNAGMTILLVGGPPLFFCVISLALYSPRLIWIYFKHRELDELLASRSQLDRQGFSKILALGLFDVLITLPFGVINLFTTIFQEGGIHTFWPGWKTTHSEISFVQTLTLDEWKSAGWGFSLSIRFGQWNNPLYAMLFFVLFGCTEKNVLRYRNAFWKIAKPFGFRRTSPKASAIMFESGPMQGSIASVVHTNDTMNQPTASENRRGSIDGVIGIEEPHVQVDAFGTQTTVFSPPLSRVPLEDA